MIHINQYWPDALGIFGVLLVLLAYLGLQLHKINLMDVSYHALNLCGSILILISLFYHWNLASVFIEICWLSISLYGLIKNSFCKK
ncbi:MAG: putative rane spanning protein [Francisellaceae bacterium]|nr:putative rane spanning protein [Francisellaceae bacterium]